MAKAALQQEIRDRVEKRLSPLLVKYGMDLSELDAILKWKPIVLILGNYSSGKSTLINELIGSEIQRTGQAPTDDSFTIITSRNSHDATASAEFDDEDLSSTTSIEIPGATIVSDNRLPFGSLKSYGDQLIAHLSMKLVESPLLENLAIIDSPGMLDSVTERDRGYDYSGVIGDFARLADLIILMFDPHKAGTIKETYAAIRNTLPNNTDEDRIIFAMSRIDECDNIADLVHSYGALCWNLSQMTGRKDIPRIFLTFSPDVAANREMVEAWIDERNQLKQKILGAPELRISHILQSIDKRVNDVKMVSEAMAQFVRQGRRLLAKTMKFAFAGALLASLLLDQVTHHVAAFPSHTLLSALLSQSLTPEQLIIPGAGVFSVFLLAALFFFKWIMPRHRRRALAEPAKLVSLDTAYRAHTWSRVESNVISLISKGRARDLLAKHDKYRSRLERFQKEELQDYYARIS